MKITRKTNLLELIKKHPKIARVLVEDYGLHCVGCIAAAFETLEQGAKAHGMGRREIEKMVDKLNSKLQAPKFK